MSLRRSQSESRMREIRTSGLMSGDGKRDGAKRQHPRPSSTLPPVLFLGVTQCHNGISAPNASRRTTTRKAHCQSAAGLTTG